MAHISSTQAADAAANQETLELTQHSSSVEVGVGYVGSSSFKAGEYNGLQKDGAYGVGNVDLRGGASYDSEDATRWRVQANDLGLDSRDLSVEYELRSALHYCVCHSADFDSRVKTFIYVAVIG